MINNIVLNIPHSSRIIHDISEWDGDISEDIERWTDHYTDQLFYSNNEKVNSCIFNFSRFCVDVERLLDDPMNEIGQGIIYTKFGDRTRYISKKNYSYYMKQWFNYYTQLQSKIENNTLLIDCHSFPSDICDTDICIGWNNNWSKPCDKTIDIIKDVFNGYKIDFNKPYSNSITPIMPFKYKSVMIEFNKSWYLNKNNTKKDDFDKKNKLIQYLYERILNNE